MTEEVIKSVIKLPARSVFSCLAFFFRDLLLPDGNRVSAFSVASTAIAAAQWSSTQVRYFLKSISCVSFFC